MAKFHAEKACDEGGCTATVTAESSASQAVANAIASRGIAEHKAANHGGEPPKPAPKSRGSKSHKPKGS